MSLSTGQNAANTSDSVTLTCVSLPMCSESGERAMWCEGAATRHGAHLERVQCSTQWHAQRLHQPERNKTQQAAGGCTYCSGETTHTRNADDVTVTVQSQFRERLCVRRCLHLFSHITALLKYELFIFFDNSYNGCYWFTSWYKHQFPAYIVKTNVVTFVSI